MFRKSDEQGAAAILTALSLLLLMGFVSLAIDSSMGYDDRRDTQNSADNAALAAAWEACNPVASGSPNPTQAARRIATQNGYNDSSPNIEVQVNSLGGSVYEVIILSTENTTFGKLPPISDGDLTVVSRAVADCKTFPFLGGYALFAGAPSTCNGGVEMDLSGSSQIVNGGIHSNGDMKITGSAPDINGPVTYLGDFNGDAGDADPEKIFGSPIPYPIEVTLSEFAPGGTRAVAAGADYHSTTGNITDNWLRTNGFAVNAGGGKTEITVSGIYYTTGNIALTNTQVAPGVKVTFASIGNIDITGSGNYTAYSPVIGGANDPGILAISDDGSASCTEQDIKWAVSTGTWSGVMFAPNGAIVFSASSGSTLNGSIFAYTVNLSGSSFNITWQDNPDADPDFDLSLKQ